MKRSERRAAVGSLVLLAIFCVFGVGCGRTISRTAERKVRDVLPRYIGPARVWRAHVDGSPMATINGRLSRLTIDGEAVQLRQAILLDSLHIEMRDVVVDTGKQQLESVGTTTFQAVVGDAALNDYLKRSNPPDDDPTRLQRVALENGRLRIEATRRWLGRDWPFSVTVEPRLASPTRLEFDPDRMSVLGLRLPLPASVLRWFARRLDEGFDFTSLPFPVRIAGFRVEPGRITLEGSADVLQSLRAEMGRR